MHNEIDTHKPFCVLEKDGLRINLFQDGELAEKDNPEFRLVTENIEEVFCEGLLKISRAITSQSE